MSLSTSSPPEDVARAIVAEGIRRGYARELIIAIISTLLQESGLRMVWSPNRKWFGYAQQDTSYPNRMDPMGNLLGFFDRLDEQMRKPGKSTDPFANIFWLQQGPNWPSAAHALEEGRRDYYDEIRKHIDKAVEFYNRYSGEAPRGGAVAVSGDPVWLEDVLKPVLGDRLVVHEGWKERGVGGTMGVIWGTMVHHTGNDNERVEIIRDGVQQPGGFLPGPLSQFLLTRDGKLHLIAVGPCNHAGGGNWGTLTDGNRQAIGIECAYDGNPAEWPRPMILTLRDTCAAISKHIGKAAKDSVCGHKEYAKPQGRKIDPSNMDMNWLRGEVQKDIDGFLFPGEPGSPPPPKPVDPKPPAYTVPPNHTELMYDQQVGRWEMLGWQTQVETLAQLRDAILGTKDAGKRGFTRGPGPEKK